MKERSQAFIHFYEETFKPLFKELNEAAWKAEITGKEEDYKRVEELNFKISSMLANSKNFEELKQIFEKKEEINDSTIRREIEILYHVYLSHQIDTLLQHKIIALETAIAKTFNTFRAEVDGKQLTDNQIEDILSSSTNNDELKKVWLAHKSIGRQIENDLRELVRLRNEAAKRLGFKNYHDMSLRLSEQDPEEIERIFDELDSLTREPFIKLKSTMDKILAKRYGVTPEELMPWHYQNRYFQEAPKIYKLDLDNYYKGKDVVVLTKDFFTSIGLDVEDILKRSDLYEKQGKSQHAFCLDVDNEGDIRVLCNIKDNYKWMNTMLHELGHAVYEKYISMDLPYVLREPAHTFTTEAIAMLFGRLASNAGWMKDMLGLSDEEASKISNDAYLYLQLEQLVFSRWSQVMYRFEKSMYENPDQDLNKQWWDLVEKYQMIKKPSGRNEPDWATKIHIATSPCYYHNYLLGELLASQLHAFICKNIIKKESFDVSYVGRTEIGNYLKKYVFAPGALYHWNTMIEKATGEKLTSKYYAEQFIKGL
ncbi:MAG: M2 family metallopeptidase [Bacteroidales bacterium]|nr:M2 family metallopeptidase [Bacteroidales bacterium]